MGNRVLILLPSISRPLLGSTLWGVMMVPFTRQSFLLIPYILSPPLDYWSLLISAYLNHNSPCLDDFSAYSLRTSITLLESSPKITARESDLTVKQCHARIYMRHALPFGSKHIEHQFPDSSKPIRYITCKVLFRSLPGSSRA